MPADGYNLFYTVKAVMAIVPHLYPQAKYNPLRDFKAVSQVLIVPHIITATPNAPYNTMAELVTYAKANPGKVNYASLGVGSQPHVALEAWARRLGIQLTHVPYKTAPAPDVMSGVVDLYLEASTTAIPSIQGKRIKALVVSGAERIQALPDVPTMTEFNPALDPNGVIGNSWHTFFAPAGTPDDIVSRLNTEIVKIVKMPEVQTRLRSLGLTPTGTAASAVNSGMASDYAYWGKLIKELGIKVE
jgi:tripartite-type tricarboxylate transporter receptor subunit TctC